MNDDQLLATLCSLDPRVEREEKARPLAIKLPCMALLEIMTKLKNEPALHFDMLLSHTAVHWPNEQNFELIYNLHSMLHRHHLMIVTSVPAANPVVDSVQSLWRIAEWQEREVYDLFGVLYNGHPDLRRLLLEDNWKGFPLRKDYKDDFMLERP